ncbi:DUF2637 domain-containing protein [Actinopolyspora halophila]|uniref:DUF2637 domain-containing protein n=1 Tax=Actinopolyspora halophila TaxID=1850 RepID=UPI000361B01C|nr:DUF2637 domain-containing protein [Actinopolyspora halophila]
MTSYRVTLLAVAVVTAVAAVVSFVHLREVAIAAGEEWRAWLLPLSVDGLVVAGSLSAFQSRRNGVEVHGMTVVSLGTGLFVSLAANVIVPFLDEIPEQAMSILSAAVAAWPAVALALAFEQLLRVQRSTVHSSEQLESQEESLSEQESVPEEPPDTSPLGSASAPETVSAAESPWLPIDQQLEDDRHVAEQLRNQKLTPAEARAAALEQLRSDPDLSAETLGTMFGRSARWGRDRRKEFRQQAETSPEDHPHLVAVE